MEQAPLVYVDAVRDTTTNLSGFYISVFSNNGEGKRTKSVSMITFVASDIYVCTYGIILNSSSLNSAPLINLYIYSVFIKKEKKTELIFFCGNSIWIPLIIS